MQVDACRGSWQLPLRLRLSGSHSRGSRPIRSMRPVPGPCLPKEDPQCLSMICFQKNSNAARLRKSPARPNQPPKKSRLCPPPGMLEKPEPARPAFAGVEINLAISSHLAHTRRATLFYVDLLSPFKRRSVPRLRPTTPGCRTDAGNIYFGDYDNGQWHSKMVQRNQRLRLHRT